MTLSVLFNRRALSALTHSLRMMVQQHMPPTALGFITTLTVKLLYSIFAKQRNTIHTALTTTKSSSTEFIVSIVCFLTGRLPVDRGGNKGCILGFFAFKMQ
jgi:hypothetical protein